ncbi:hypothetical protein NHX12_030829 [Muraenolepis orangiensis]|uniref:Uncharacterized protein n=1 Tax=Muraenolepis orangiensis TaxID=630683 RepID=A0A9Q0IM06_9TELE|nr:hypothetical protein NHX12_030829 [Muraenolepis orangiensis]
MASSGGGEKDCVSTDNKGLLQDVLRQQTEEGCVTRLLPPSPVNPRSFLPLLYTYLLHLLPPSPVHPHSFLLLLSTLTPSSFSCPPSLLPPSPVHRVRTSNAVKKEEDKNCVSV